MPSYPHKFRPGDTVTIRAWDDMVKEFGTDSYGDIPTLPIAIFQSVNNPRLKSRACSSESVL